MRKLLMTTLWLPLLLFSQPYEALGPSKIFLNSFENLITFPSSIAGYNNFITFSTGNYIDPVGILMRWQKFGNFVYLNDSTMNVSAAYFTFNREIGFNIGYKSSSCIYFTASGGYATPFAKFDAYMKILTNTPEFVSGGLKIEKEINDQSLAGAFVNATKDSVSILADYMLAPTDNRIFFIGGGISFKSGHGSPMLTVGAYFPVVSWLYLKFSGDYVRNQEYSTTYIVKRFGINIEYQDFSLSFELNPRILLTPPYIYSGVVVEEKPVISTTILYRFHTF